MTTQKTKSAFASRIFVLVLPIVVQNLLSSAVNSMDVVMLNYVGQDAIAAASLASQFAHILFMFYYGLGTGATMMCAQYFGKGEMQPIRIVEGLALRFSVSITAVVTLCALFIPEWMMRIYTNDPVLIELGAIYLRYVCVAYVCWSLCEIYLAVLRSLGRVTISMCLNVMAFSLNIILNAVFIFGLFGAPKMGIAGVALATALSRVIELIGCIIVSMRSKDIKLDLRYMFLSNKLLTKDFIRMAIPATANDIVWGLAFSMYSVVLGHMGSDVVAANSLVTVVRNFGTVLCFGMASAGGILLGQIIGEGDMEEAKIGARQLLVLTVISGAVGGLLLLLASPFVLRFADLSPTALGYLKIMLYINTYYIMGIAVNTTMICGIFRSGGDSMFGLKCDAMSMWLYAVPLSFLAAFVFKLPVMWVYFLMCTDEFIKWPFVIRHYLSGKWLKNITRDNLFAEEH